MHIEGVEFKATKLFKLSDNTWLDTLSWRQRATRNRFLLFQLFPAFCYVAKICRSSVFMGPCSAEHAEHA